MDFFTVENLIALLTLTSLEIVLGIDNIVFIAILTGNLPEEIQSRTRRLGLFMAMFMRIGLLFAISWLSKLTTPFMSLFEHPISGRDVILIAGGLFLIAKATFEIHGTVEGGDDSHEGPAKKSNSMTSAIVQIMLLDIVFSLDSVITAVGMVDHVTVMVVAVVLAVGVMMIFANPLSNFIMKHPTIKMLALAFLVLIGFVLLAEGFGKHIEKGYIYFAIGFSVFVEFLNYRFRSRRPA